MQKILGLLADMGSDEVFMYGDKTSVDFVELFQTVDAAQSYGPMLAQITGQTEERQSAQIQAGAVISALAHNLKLIGVPNLVVGFKLKNTDLAKEELIKLEIFAGMVLENIEQTKGHFKKTKVGNHDYLVLNLDGGMVPWDQVPLEKLKEMEAEEGDAQKIIDRLKKSKLVVAIGVRDNYLLVSIGSSLDCLKKLGHGQRLIDRAEFKPLEKHVDKRLARRRLPERSLESAGERSKEEHRQPAGGRRAVAQVGRTVRQAKAADRQGPPRRWPRTLGAWSPSRGP